MPEPLITPHPEITEALVNAAAKTTGLRPEQITAIEVDQTHITITYTGAMPGLMGGAGRNAIQTFDTKTGKLISDEAIR